MPDNWKDTLAESISQTNNLDIQYVKRVIQVVLFDSVEAKSSNSLRITNEIIQIGLKFISTEAFEDATPSATIEAIDIFAKYNDVHLSKDDLTKIFLDIEFIYREKLELYSDRSAIYSIAINQLTSEWVGTIADAKK